MITWSPQQQAVFDFVEKGRGNAIVVAVAGAGKTTTLVEATRRMSGWVFLGAYNRSMGAELKERVAGMKDVTASTLHAAGFRALSFVAKRGGYRIDVDDKKMRRLADTIVTGKPDLGFHPESPRPDLESFAAFAIKTASMAKQVGIGVFSALSDEGPWKEIVDRHGLDEALGDEPTPADVAKGIAFARCLLKRSGSIKEVVDFDDMIYHVLLHNVRMLQYDWVLIDEAQDTNPVRRALAKKMLKPGGRLIAVGDPRQAIFGFTGADNDALDQIRREFNAIELPLTTTYRCPKRVVAEARKVVDHIEAHETAPDGEVRSIAYAEAFQGTETTPDVLPTDAILCRYNKPLVDLAFSLIRRGVACKIEGRDIGAGLAALAKRWKVKRLETLRDRLESYRDREIQKAMAKGNESRADRVSDQVATLMVLIERAAERQLDRDGLVQMIGEMFADDVSGIAVLSSVHKSKGREWDRVFLLGRDELMPSRFARQDWQVEQEMNLVYVAVTRAKRELVLVEGVPA